MKPGDRVTATRKWLRRMSPAFSVYRHPQGAGGVLPAFTPNYSKGTLVGKGEIGWYVWWDGDQEPVSMPWDSIEPRGTFPAKGASQ